MKLWEWAEGKLKAEEVNNQLLLATDKQGKPAFKLAASEGILEVLQKVWEWGQKKLTREEIKRKMLLATDNKGMTAWHWAACKGKTCFYEIMGVDCREINGRGGK